MNSDYNLPCYFSKKHFNIILAFFALVFQSIAFRHVLLSTRSVSRVRRHSHLLYLDLVIIVMFIFCVLSDLKETPRSIGMCSKSVGKFMQTLD
jgi:hypothetical protein